MASEISRRRLHRSSTCSDVVFSNSPPLLSQTYQEASRVLITVTVEASPGPIRTLLKLSSSVEEAIKLVIDQYANEGRRPPLDSDASSLYELHLSYFSLECLDRSDTIRSLGSRRFYLRRRRNVIPATRAVKSEISCVDDETMGGSRQPCLFMVILPGYISRGIAGIFRRMSNLWKIFGCLQYDS